MRFFSEEYYRKTQISGILSFPLTREGWDEYLTFMREIEVDYEEQARTSLNCNRDEMLALLPVSLHPYIQDGTINRPYTPPELAKLIEEWNRDLLEQSREQGRQWREAYESIKYQLPPGAVKIREHSLHDAHFVSYERLSGDQIILLFNESDAEPVQLTFTGVHSVHIPQNMASTDWYMEEFELTDHGFAISILLEKTQGGLESFVEMRIEAADLRFDRAPSRSQNQGVS